MYVLCKIIIDLASIGLLSMPSVGLVGSTEKTPVFGLDPCENARFGMARRHTKSRIEPLPQYKRIIIIIIEALKTFSSK